VVTIGELFQFEPDAVRAKAVEHHIRKRLAASLCYIVEQVNGHIPFIGEAIDGFLARLALGPVSPLIFGAYCDLVLAINDERIDLAEALLAEIAAAPNRPAELLIRDLADPRRYLAANRYARFVDTDPTVSLSVLPPPPEIATECRERIAAAFDLLEAGDRAIADEIRALIGEIVLAVGADDPSSFVFDSASSFMLWGAIVLKAKRQRTVLDAAQALAHESGHNLLFGLCADGPMVENDDEARYPSPLRAEPRPMDGIVHATYVTARMHRVLARLLQAGVLDSAATTEAKASLAGHRAAFAQGMEVIDRHARLTARGRAIMSGACAHMAASA
jgi:HEXXH motif-containing protein